MIHSSFHFSFGGRINLRQVQARFYSRLNHLPPLLPFYVILHIDTFSQQGLCVSWEAQELFWKDFWSIRSERKQAFLADIMTLSCGETMDFGFGGKFLHCFQGNSCLKYALSGNRITGLLGSHLSCPPLTPTPVLPLRKAESASHLKPTINRHFLQLPRWLKRLNLTICDQTFFLNSTMCTNFTYRRWFVVNANTQNSVCQLHGTWYANICLVTWKRGLLIYSCTLTSCWGCHTACLLFPSWDFLSHPGFKGQQLPVPDLVYSNLFIVNIATQSNM